jgi:nucleoside-diphosphate-sugar epimerase
MNDGAQRHDVTKVALVTGGTGFVGSHLLLRLVHDGWRVHAVVRNESNLDVLEGAVSHVTVHRHDGTTETMCRILKETKPTLVFHLASLFLSEHAPADVSRLLQSNILFGTQLAEAMTAAGVKLLVNTGTSWQHYQDRSYDPVNLYAATKQAFESVIEFYVQARGTRVITLKLFDTYGPKDRRRKLFSLLADAASKQQTLDMSPGEQNLDLVFIDDVVDGFCVAARLLLDGQVIGNRSYALSSLKPVRLKEVVAIYERVAGVTVPVRWGGRPYRAREVMHSWKTSEVLPGWTARFGLEEGIRRMLGKSQQ